MATAVRLLGPRVSTISPQYPEYPASSIQHRREQQAGTCTSIVSIRPYVEFRSRSSSRRRRRRC